jgi:hypothetical protein
MPRTLKQREGILKICKRTSCGPWAKRMNMNGPVYTAEIFRIVIGIVNYGNLCGDTDTFTQLAPAMLRIKTSLDFGAPKHVIKINHVHEGISTDDESSLPRCQSPPDAMCCHILQTSHPSLLIIE